MPDKVKLRGWNRKKVFEHDGLQLWLAPGDPNVDPPKVDMILERKKPGAPTVWVQVWHGRVQVGKNQAPNVENIALGPKESS